MTSLKKSPLPSPQEDTPLLPDQHVQFKGSSTLVTEYKMQQPPSPSSSNSEHHQALAHSPARTDGTHRHEHWRHAGRITKAVGSLAFMHSRAPPRLSTPLPKVPIEELEKDKESSHAGERGQPFMDTSMQVRGSSGGISNIVHAHGEVSAPSSPRLPRVRSDYVPRVKKFIVHGSGVDVSPYSSPAHPELYHAHHEPIETAGVAPEVTAKAKIACHIDLSKAEALLAKHPHTESVGPMFVVTRTSPPEEVKTLKELLLEVLPRIQDQRPFWIDVQGLNQDSAEILAKVFGLHPLTQEDLNEESPNEKIETFPRYVYIVQHGLNFNPDDEVTNTIPTSVVLFSDVILTFHPVPNRSLPQTMYEIEQLYNNVMPKTPDWIMYTYVDSLVDMYLPVVDSLVNEVDAVSELVLVLGARERSDLLRRISIVTRGVTAVRRILIPKIDILPPLASHAHPLISENVRVYMRDVVDHVIRMIQVLENSRDTLSTAYSNYLALVNVEVAEISNRQSDIAKKVSAVATIVLPMTLVASIFGMNVPVPGNIGGVTGDQLGWFFGLIGGMILISLCVVVAFSRSGWL